MGARILGFLSLFLTMFPTSRSPGRATRSRRPGRRTTARPGCRPTAGWSTPVWRCDRVFVNRQSKYPTLPSSFPSQENCLKSPLQAKIVGVVRGFSYLSGEARGMTNNCCSQKRFPVKGLCSRGRGLPSNFKSSLSSWAAPTS